MPGLTYAFDTGPLLCFALLPRGPRLLRDRYDGRAFTTSDVDRELRGLRRSHITGVAKAATTAVDQLNWIPRVSFESVDDNDAIEDLVLRLQTFKKRSSSPSPTSRYPDRGECSILHLARINHRTVVANENAARELARSLSLATICADDILAAMLRDNVLTRKQASNAHRTMTDAGLDPGR